MPSSFCLSQALMMQQGYTANLQPEAVAQGIAPEESSVDSLFNGRLICRQPRHGYRFSVDAVLLAHFVKPRPGWRVLDLGSGCGIIALILAYRVPDCSLVAVEHQPVLASLARHNARINGFASRLQVIEADIRSRSAATAAESFDFVVCNPPYFSRGRGRINREEQAARARHDLSGNLADFVGAAAFAVKNRGRVAFVFPASSQARLQHQLFILRLVPKRLQMVYSYPAAQKASLVLVEAVKNGGESCTVMPPLYLYDRPGGGCSAALQMLYQEERCWPQS